MIYCYLYYYYDFYVNTSNSYKQQNCKVKVLTMASWSLLLMQIINPSLIKSETLYGSNFDCKSFNSCRDDTLICNPYSDCNVTCSQAATACESATILCPIDGNCHIDCSDDDVTTSLCADITINATQSTSLTFKCSNNYRACDDFTLHCPINGHGGPIQCKLTGADDNAISSMTSRVLIHIHILKYQSATCTIH